MSEPPINEGKVEKDVELSFEFIMGSSLSLGEDFYWTENVIT
jgi:hypothetical protein